MLHAAPLKSRQSPVNVSTLENTSAASETETLAEASRRHQNPSGPEAVALQAGSLQQQPLPYAGTPPDCMESGQPFEPAPAAAPLTGPCAIPITPEPREGSGAELLQGAPNSVVFTHAAPPLKIPTPGPAPSIPPALAAPSIMPAPGVPGEPPSEPLLSLAPLPSRDTTREASASSCRDEQRAAGSPLKHPFSEAGVEEMLQSDKDKDKDRTTIACASGQQGATALLDEPGAAHGACQNLDLNLDLSAAPSDPLSGTAACTSAGSPSLSLGLEAVPPPTHGNKSAGGEMRGSYASGSGERSFVHKANPQEEPSSGHEVRGAMHAVFGVGVRGSWQNQIDTSSRLLHQGGQERRLGTSSDLPFDPDPPQDPTDLLTSSSSSLGQALSDPLGLKAEPKTSELYPASYTQSKWSFEQHRCNREQELKRARRRRQRQHRKEREMARQSWQFRSAGCDRDNADDGRRWEGGAPAPFPTDVGAFGTHQASGPPRAGTSTAMGWRRELSHGVQDGGGGRFAKPSSSSGRGSGRGGDVPRGRQSGGGRDKRRERQHPRVDHHGKPAGTDDPRQGKDLIGPDGDIASPRGSPAGVPHGGPQSQNAPWGPPPYASLPPDGGGLRRQIFPPVASQHESQPRGNSVMDDEVTAARKGPPMFSSGFKRQGRMLVRMRKRQVSHMRK